MKKIIGTILLTVVLSSAAASSADPEAYVLASKPPAYGMIPASNMIYALMLHSPCTMPIANSRNLKAARIFNNRTHPERFDVGCWGITLNPSRDEVVVIGATGHIDSGISLTAFVRATIGTSGDGTAIGPAMTFEQRQRNIEKYEKSIR